MYVMPSDHHILFLDSMIAYQGGKINKNLKNRMHLNFEVGFY